MVIKKSFLYLLVLFILLAFSHAQAFGPFKVRNFLNRNNMVIIHSTVNIDQNETTPGNIIAILSDVNVNGKVNGNLISIFGSVKIGPKAEITKNFFSIMNTIEKQPGAMIDINNIEINLPGKAFLVRIAKFWLNFLVLNIIIGIIVLAILIWLYIQFIIPKININGMVKLFTANAPLMFLYGILGIIVLRIISLVLLVTIVGSGAAILFALAVNLLFLIGFISVITYIGSIINTLLKTKLSSAAQFILGIIGLFILAFVPILGFCIIVILSIMGFGAILTQFLKLKVTR